MSMTTHTGGHLSGTSKRDGSATCSSEGYHVVARVDGPMAIQRHDEPSFEAAIDVVVRPSGNIGGKFWKLPLLLPTVAIYQNATHDTDMHAHLPSGIRVRQLESIVEGALRQLILLKRYPRCAFQVTLQVTQSPQNDLTSENVNQAETVSSFSLNCGGLQVSRKGHLSQRQVILI